MSGRLVVISGPSGVGKTTVCRALLERPGFRRVVTATSRPPRPGERDGSDYRFLSEEAFLERIGRGDFLEHARVHGHLYGTPRRDVEEALRDGKRVLLNIDVQGARQIRDAVRSGAPIPLTLIFLEPPSMEELRRRLSGRGTDDPDTVARRLRTALAEMAEKPLYDHAIVNDDVASAVRRILEILGPPTPNGASREREADGGPGGLPAARGGGGAPGSSSPIPETDAT